MSCDKLRDWTVRGWVHYRKTPLQGYRVLWADAAEVQRRDVFSLTDAVSLAPGVRVQQLGGPGQLASIHLRGLRNQDTAVLVDGLRLRDAGAIQGDATGLIQDLVATNAGRIGNLTAAASNWFSNGTGNFDSDGRFNFTNRPDFKERFFRLQIP